ncbi:MAG: CotH kinase family protein [Planctomycetota bacterium]
MRIGAKHRGAGRFGWAALFGLGIGGGVLLGLALPRPRAVDVPPPAPTVRQPTPALLPPPHASTGDLPVLRAEFAAADWQHLAQNRERAMAQKFLLDEQKDPVPVTLHLGAETARGTARLKGDWLDHIDTDQWSLRFDLDAPLRGMRHFAVQHPKTRGFVMEWLVMQTARRLGLLAPRTFYVEMAVNDRAPGVYYLEEVPGKELLESEGRRDGAIVRFDERALWSTHQQTGFLTIGALPADFERMFHVFDAPTEVLGAARLRSTEDLENRLLRARGLALELQQRIVAQDLAAAPLRTLRALQSLEGRTVDDLFQTDKLGRLLALLTFYQGFHGLFWNQLRLYHDPVTDRLEPIVNDTEASFLLRPGELVVGAPEARWFTSSPATLCAAYAELGRMTEPAFVQGLIADLRPELERIAGALSRHHIEVPGIGVLDSLDLLLRQQVDRLHEFVRPRVAAAFAATAGRVAAAPGETLRVVDVIARATSRVPTIVHAFRFAKGNEVPAELALVGLADEPDTRDAVAVRPDGVLLPPDGSAVRFRVPVDHRLAGLTDVQAIKRAIRSAADPKAGDLELAVHFRPVAETALRKEALVLDPAPQVPVPIAGRPRAEPLAKVLAGHPFLEFDLVNLRLAVQPGEHVVAGDLVLPEDRTLFVPAGTTLRFAPGAVLVAGALQVEGTAAAPVRFAPRVPAEGFGGVLVLGSAASSCRFLQVEGHTCIARGGWQCSGGVTFRRAPVALADCSFTGARGEDSVNVIGATFRFERCTWQGGPHDLFDGDFVDGDVIACRFLDSGEDAIDVSGSPIRVEGCDFDRIGDKAFSIGEGSDLVARDNHVHQASIAAAAKDRSHLVLDRLTVDAVAHFVFASYVKKPEFGAATLVATGLVWTGQGAPQHLCQTGCTITVDGTAVPAQAVDVDAMYRDKVLGK